MSSVGQLPVLTLYILKGWAVSFEAPNTPSSTSTVIEEHDDCSYPRRSRYDPLILICGSIAQSDFGATTPLTATTPTTQPSSPAVAVTLPHPLPPPLRTRLRLRRSLRSRRPRTITSSWALDPQVSLLRIGYRRQGRKCFCSKSTS